MIKVLRCHLKKIVAVVAFLFLSLGVFFYFWILADLPSLSTLSMGMTLPSTRFYDRNGVLLYDISAPQTGRNDSLPFEAFPDSCVNALISTEDANYWSHIGVDLVGVLRAIWINVQGQEVIAGGSTITQQTVRLLLLDPQGRNERTLQRKLKEMVLALQLSSTLSKQEVLALYMNQVYLGNLAYGFQAASQAYFQKPVGALSLAECAFLAGMVQNAAAYDPLTNFDAAKARQQIVLDLMVQNNAITRADADAAATDQLQFASSPFQIRAPHAVMTALQELEQAYPQQLYNGGLDITLTIDVNWTEQAQSIVQKQLNLLNNPPPDTRQSANANNAALIALDPFTGEILTMLGSPDYFDAEIDGALNATLALRQPGSTLKPFTYALAMNPSLANPYTPATMLLDVQTPFITRRLESYSPGNYGLVEHGPVSLREALGSSYNIPAVATLDFIGIEPFLALLSDAGIKNLAQGGTVDLSVALGGGEVRLLDLAQAYSVFANGGLRVEPVLIQRIVTHDGEVLYDYEAPRLTTRVLDERVTYLITDILSDNDARLPSFGINNPLQIGRPAAAKTGTTTDYHDNWVMGYTPNLVVGVWVGNADNSPMVDVTGITGAGPIWNLFLRDVTTGAPIANFPRPDGLIETKICIPSGLLPTSVCPLVRQEWFIEGTQPTQFDNLYQTFVLDRTTRTLATDSTPLNERVEQVFLVLRQEAQAWGVQHGIPQPPNNAVSVAPNDDNNPVRLLDPDPYTTFEISNTLPLSTQRLRFTVAAPANTVEVTYLLNGEPIGNAASSPYAVWWILAEGQYTLIARATLTDGTTLESEGVPFNVVKDGEVAG